MPRMNKVGKTATSVFNDATTLRVQYHRTVVVEVDKIAGVCTLNTGGWESYTTKARMNQAACEFGLGFSVAQVKGAWFVHIHGGPALPFVNGRCTFPIKA